MPADLWHRLSRHGRFLERDAAEATDRFKQLIPYCVLRHQDRVFVYQRRAAGHEAQLRGRLSIGFGGHIEPVDLRLTPLATILAGATREIAEEVRTPPGALDLLGTLDDDTDPVGARHLGIVLVLNLPTWRVRIREHGHIARVGRGWHAPGALQRLVPSLESWSALVADHLVD